MAAIENHFPNERPGENSSIGIHGAQLAPGERRNHAHLPVHQVSPRFANDLFAVLGVHADRNLVSHGAGGDKQPCLVAQDLRCPGFQPIHRGIFTVDVIAYFGRSHSIPHGGRRMSDGVAAQVDHAHRVGQECSSSTPRKRAKTSFESKAPRGVRLTTPFSSVSSASPHRSRTTGSKSCTRSRPNSVTRCCHATPARRRSPKNHASSNSSVESNRRRSCGGDPARYSANTAVELKRRAAPAGVRTMECASSPKPR